MDKWMGGWMDGLVNDGRWMMDKWTGEWIGGL